MNERKLVKTFIFFIMYYYKFILPDLNFSIVFSNTSHIDGNTSLRMRRLSTISLSELFKSLGDFLLLLYSIK